MFQRLLRRYTSTTSTMSRYENWTREQLLERIAALESSTTNVPSKRSINGKPRKEQRPFDMSKYSQRHIALKVAYLGWNYMGFAAQGNEEAVPTVEGRLFQALQSCRLIVDPDQCQFSRCGRTDKGVSGLGQVVSLRVRSNLPQKAEEIPYIETINRLLPDDIRVLAWAPVSETFNSRFDCRSRTYKYFFPRGKLDLDLMRQGASYFIGEHDFRNFCKLDPSKNITNYKRTVLSLDIRPVAPPALGSSDSTGFFEVELKGTAFLWHQVRCIMSILFLVGQKLERPEIIQDLLDVSKIEARPDYPMASELPLLLYDCEFDDLDWKYAGNGAAVSTATPVRIYQHWQDLWAEHMTRTLLCQTFMASMRGYPVESGSKTLASHLETHQDDPPAIVLGGGKEVRSSRYKKLLDRPRCDSDEVKKEKYRAKKKQKTNADTSTPTSSSSTTPTPTITNNDNPIDKK